MLVALVLLTAAPVTESAAQQGAVGRGVEVTGLIEEPEITTYQYGTHAVTDEASGERYALVEDEEGLLDPYVDERANVSGAIAPGFEEGGLEGGPPLVRVAEAEPAADGTPGEASAGAPQPETGVDLNGDGAVDAGDGRLAAAVSDAAMQADRASAARTLPATGGAPPFHLRVVCLAGTLLAAAGLLARHVSR